MNVPAGCSIRHYFIFLVIITTIQGVEASNHISLAVEMKPTLTTILI